MDQEKIGKFIRQIRKNNNLTQAQLANKYGVTYQAVSKWENGKNIPDVSLLKQMSKDFNINIEDILEGKISKQKSTKLTSLKLISLFTIIIIILIVTIIIIFKNHDHDFSFKTISSSCNSFTISGSIAYNDTKSSIYISNINYCGGNDNTLYSKIDCILYERNNNTEVKISEYKYKDKSPIKLEEFLKNVSFNIDNYNRMCKDYQKNTLYLIINAYDSNNKITSYRIPISPDNDCNN